MRLQSVVTRLYLGVCAGNGFDGVGNGVAFARIFLLGRNGLRTLRHDREAKHGSVRLDSGYSFAGDRDFGGAVGFL